MKAAWLSDVITDNHPEAGAVCKTCIADNAVTASDTMKLELAPPGFVVLHVHQLVQPSGSIRDGGLTFIAATAANEVVICTHPTQKTVTAQKSFEWHLLNVKPRLLTKRNAMTLQATTTPPRYIYSPIPTFPRSLHKSSSLKICPTRPMPL